MKKCPYCAEEIQDDAIKCRFCNEWLDKGSSMFNVFERAKKFMSKFSMNVNKDNSDHIFIPTEETPLIVENLKLFPDRMEVADKKIFLDDLETIAYSAKEEILNFVRRLYTLFIVDAYIGTELFTITISNLGSNKALVSTRSRRTFEQLSFINNYISKFSFETRITKYIDELREHDFFTYRDYDFFADGSICSGRRKLANVLDAHAQGLIGFGETWTALNPNISSKNPYEFIVASGGPRVKIFGFETGNTLKIDAIIDTDVFFSLISYLIDNKKYPI